MLSWSLYIEKQMTERSEKTEKQLDSENVVRFEAQVKQWQENHIIPISLVLPATIPRWMAAVILSDGF